MRSKITGRSMRMDGFCGKSMSDGEMGKTSDRNMGGSSVGSAIWPKDKGERDISGGSSDSGAIRGRRSLGGGTTPKFEGGAGSGKPFSEITVEVASFETSEESWSLLTSCILLSRLFDPLIRLGQLFECPSFHLVLSRVSLGLFESGKVVQQARRFDGPTFLKARLIQAMPQRYLGRFSVKHVYYTCLD
jgi:hypothetical protein